MKPKDYFSVHDLHEIEKEVILKNLKFYKGNRTHTAKALAISIRTLRNKLNEYRAEGVPEHLLLKN
jgi:DNA-binding NtrC family response regulator